MEDTERLAWCDALSQVTGIKLSQSWFAAGVRLRIEFSGWYAKPVKNRLKIWKPVQTSAFKTHFGYQPGNSIPRRRVGKALWLARQSFT
jgi:hypothetical protein